MLDTLKIADMLRDAGFEERQARAVANVQKQAVEEGGITIKNINCRGWGDWRVERRDFH